MCVMKRPPNYISRRGLLRTKSGAAVDLIGEEVKIVAIGKASTQESAQQSSSSKEEGNFLLTNGIKKE